MKKRLALVWALLFVFILGGSLAEEAPDFAYHNEVFEKYPCYGYAVPDDWTQTDLTAAEVAAAAIAKWQSPDGNTTMLVSVEDTGEGGYWGEELMERLNAREGYANLSYNSDADVYFVHYEKPAQSIDGGAAFVGTEFGDNATAFVDFTFQNPDEASLKRMNDLFLLFRENMDEWEQTEE